MLNTLTGKFSFFFWLIFLIINLSVYFVGTIHVKSILEQAEREKVQLMTRTLQPIIAMNISFEQEREVNLLLKAMLQEENILQVSITSPTRSYTLGKRAENIEHSLEYVAPIIDPFTQSDIATIKILYSNENLAILYRKIVAVMGYVFIFALLVFLTFYLYIKRELNTLKYIATTLQSYSSNPRSTPINIENASQEIKTIATITNEMMQSISKHVDELESFNIVLEKQVQEKVAKLQKQEKMMLHQSRQAAMGEMLESIAHQWRQPLNIIGLSCANLEMEYDLGVMKESAFKERMSVISQNINYMSSTIDDFRDFLNPNRKMELFNPRVAIESVLSILDAQLKNNNISYSIHERDSITIHGVENEFQQVLFVLINNAKDALKEKKSMQEPKEIRVELIEMADTNRISFCDNGGGIDESIINSIFDPYFTTKFASSGTGIGLYIAKNIIESRMKGMLSVKNREDGCCFYIEQRIFTERSK